MDNKKEKLSLDEFEKIKRYIIEVCNNYRDESEELATQQEEKEALYNFMVNQYIPAIEKLKEYDLSDIPASNWENFVFIGTNSDEFSIQYCFDLSNTGANIDFSIIDSSYLEYYNFKSCNVSNIDDIFSLSSSSFDQEVIDNNPDIFLDSTFPSEFITAYYKGQVTLELYGSLSKEQRKKINKNYLRGIFVGSPVLDFIRYLSIEKLDEIIDYYNKDDYYIDLINDINCVYLYSSFGIRNDFYEMIGKCEVKDIKEVLYKIAEYNVTRSSLYIVVSKFSETFFNENPKIFLNYPEIPGDVRERFYEKRLTLEDIYKYYSYIEDFLNSNIVDNNEVFYKIILSNKIERVKELLTNHIIFLRHIEDSNYSNIVRNGETEEEFVNRIKVDYPSIYVAYLQGDKENDYANLSFEEILKRRDLRTDEENAFLDEIIDCFGLDNIIRFQNESNYFLCEHYDSKLHNLEALYLAYEVYKKDVSFDKNDYYSFCDLISNLLIFSAKEREKKRLLFRNDIKSQSFREKYSYLFLDEDMLKDIPEPDRKSIIVKFYSKEIETSDLKKYPTLKDALKGKKIDCIFSDLVSYPKEEVSDNFLEMCTIFGRYISIISSHSYMGEVNKVREQIEDELFNKFVDGWVYNEDLPDSFKKKYSKLFLPRNAPYDLKKKFYGKTLTIEDFNEHNDWYQFFSYTDIVCGFKGLSLLIGITDDSISLEENVNRKIMIAGYYKDILDFPYEFRNTYIKFICDNYNNIDSRILKYLKDILYRLYYSNSSKLSRVSIALVKEIAYSDDPLHNLELIEEIYLQNHLPEVAKIYAVFRVLHRNKDGSLKLNLSSDSSPVLNRYSDKNRNETIIISDLIKIAIESNNKSIRKYLDDIKEGDRLYREYLKNGLSELSVDEKNKALAKISYYSKIMIALYNESEVGKKDRYSSSGDMFTDISICVKKLQPNDNDFYDVPDRLTRMFAYFAGFKSYEDMVTHMNNVVEEADKRNKERVKKPFVLHKGDLIKGLRQIKYLAPSLKNGVLATEFLGSSATDIGDSTPLDTDLSYVNADEISINNGIKNSISSIYGPIWLVVESDDSDLSISRDSDDNELDSKYQKNKIELFRTRSSGHFGIRTGFGSTHISYIVVENDSYHERLGLEVVMAGFYIPIVNCEGKLLFTIDDYERLKRAMSGLSYYGSEKYEVSSELITPEVERLAQEMKIDAPRTKAIAAKLRELFAKEFVDVVYDNDSKFTLTIKDAIDGDLTVGTVEVIDTGSTGRETNSPNDADFDFMFRLDTNIMKENSKMEAIRARLSKLLGGQSNFKGEFRVKKVKLDGIDEEIDIDISFIPKKDEINYSTDMCLKDRLRTIKKQYPKEYPYIIANIVYAKNVLKEAGCYYKHGHSKCVNGQGGLGGVGIENWILQNGGSFITATRRFLEVAYNDDKTGFVSFNQFKDKFKIWDFGENFEAKEGYEHDEFVYNNMDEAGYNVMCTVLHRELKKYDGLNEMLDDNNFSKNESVKYY